MKKCEVCERNEKIYFNKKADMLLCAKHAKQFKRNGYFFKKDIRGANSFKVFGEHTEIYIEDHKSGELIATVSIDTEDYLVVKDYKWCQASDYAYTTSVGYMHKLITKTDKNTLIDHINQNPLDNRKKNLRVADKSLNAYNVSKPRKDNKVGVRGVTKVGKKFVVHLRMEGKQTYLGRFDTVEEAGLVYESARKELLPRCVRN